MIGKLRDNKLMYNFTKYVIFPLSTFFIMNGTAYAQNKPFNFKKYNLEQIVRDKDYKDYKDIKEKNSINRIVKKPNYLFDKKYPEEIIIKKNVKEIFEDNDNSKVNYFVEIKVYNHNRNFVFDKGDEAVANIKSSKYGNLEIRVRYEDFDYSAKVIQTYRDGKIVANFLNGSLLDFKYIEGNHVEEFKWSGDNLYEIKNNKLHLIKDEKANNYILLFDYVLGTAIDNIFKEALMKTPKILKKEF